MNYKNYSDFTNPNLSSIHNNRANLWNRYNRHAQEKRDQSVFNSCHHHCNGGAPPSFGGFGTPMFGGFGMPMTGSFGMGMPMFGSFGHGNQNVNVSIGPSKSYVAGNVLGQIGGLVKNNWTSISNFCVNAYNKIFHKA